MTAWVYNTATAKYYRSKKTRPVTSKQLRKVRDLLADGVAKTIQTDAAAYLNGEIGLAAWAERFGAVIRHATMAGYFLGSGGMSAQTLATLNAIDHLIGQQTPFAERFIRELASGGLSNAEMAARAELYAGTAVKAYEQAMAYSNGIDLPVYPADGGTECLTRCRCAWVIETTDDQVMAWWDTVGDDGVCEGCASRGQQYNPLVIAR